MDSGLSEEGWLNKLERKSHSARTRITAKASMRTFDLFCKNQKVSRDEIIQQYQIWYNPKPNPEVLVRPDIEAICLSLDGFVDFMTKDYSYTKYNPKKEEMEDKICKKKSSKTISVYFGFVKSYLRLCAKVKLSVEDVKDYVTFPVEEKDPRVPLELHQLKKIVSNATVKRRALYYVLITSGMRLGEALSLTKENFHIDESPVRITLNAKQTKTKKGRECYISKEAVEKIKPLMENVSDDEMFLKQSNLSLLHNVANEDRIFGYMRTKLGFTQKYPNSVRYVVNIHSMRAYFHTKASLKHGTEYANALDGHSGYLEQYYRLSLDERGAMYQELEQDLLIESVPVESNKTKDKIITTLQEQMAEMREDMKRMQKAPDSYEITA